MTLMGFKEQLEKLGISVSHGYASLTEYPFIVYAEYAEEYQFADDIVVDQRTHVQVDYYTFKDFDENKERIKQLLLDMPGVSFQYTVTYGNQSEPIHHVFDCEVW